MTTGTLDRDRKLDEAFFDPGVAVDFTRGVSIYTYFSLRRDSFRHRGFSTFAYNANLDVTSFKRLGFSNDFEIGTDVDFDPARPEAGRMLNNTLALTLRPFTQLNSEILWIKSSLKSRTSDGKLFSQDILRNKTIYRFNRFNAVRSIAEYDTRARSLEFSLLYGFTPSPNKAIYLGYGDLFYNGIEPLDGTRQPGLKRASRTVFAKVSYNFRF